MKFSQKFFLKLNSKNSKFFLIGFLLSLPLWWGINVLQNNLENFLVLNNTTINPQIFLAQVAPAETIIDNSKPKRNVKIEDLPLQAKSALSVFINQQGNGEILFEKESDKVLPIASLTKLMTANVVLDNYDLSQSITISRNAVKEVEDSGSFKIGEVMTVKNLLYPLLIESSNDAAVALSEMIGERAIVDLINLEAKSLNLQNTRFINPTGLDPDNPDDAVNQSTAQDLVKMAIYLLKNKPLIWQISANYEMDFYSPEDVFHHRLLNTNELLKDMPNIIGGKTGWTPEAQGCLLIILNAPNKKGEIINVILGSPDRFGEMRKLIDWVNTAYRW